MRRERTESIFKATMAENFQKLGREMDNSMSEVQRTPNTVNLNRVTEAHSKLSKVKNKGRILKTAREKKEVKHKGTSYKTTDKFLNRNFQARSEWDGIFKILKENNCQPRILYLMNLSSRNEG